MGAALHPLMLVDFVALCSLYIDLSIESNELRGIGSLRMLRIFTLFRIERDWRFCHPVMHVLWTERFQMLAAVGVAMTVMVIAAACMFYAEAPYNDEYSSVGA